MPLPWKKAKVTRISQLVADLQSPKRGGSLVVETGFPNSLIDLFVKNRDQFKIKPSSKKKKKINNNPVEISDSVILSPALPTPTPSSCLNSGKFRESDVSRIESHGCRQNCDDVHDIDEGLFVDDHAVVFGKRNHMSGICLEILKILIVVVLAMATKKLVVGITLSAFVLLFVECVSKRVVCYFEPCSKTLAENLKFLIRRDEIVDSKSCAIDEIEENKTDLIIQDEEIRALKRDAVEEKNIDLVVQDEHIRATDTNLDMLNCDKRWGCEEETGIRKRVMEEDDGVGEMLEHKNRRRSGSAKFKAKVMKKFAPNKFGGSTKEKKRKETEPGSSTGVSDHTNEDKLSKSGLGKEIENDDSLSEQKQGEKRVEENIDDDGARSFGEISMAMTSINSEKMGIEKKRNLRSLILVLLILAGLLRGRTVALVLTFAWWVSLKSVGTLYRQSFYKFSEE